MATEENRLPGMLRFESSAITSERQSMVQGIPQVGVKQSMVYTQESIYCKFCLICDIKLCLHFHFGAGPVFQGQYPLAFLDFQRGIERHEGASPSFA